MNKISSSLDSRKAAYPDSEDFFQKERDWVAKYVPALTQFNEDFHKTVYSQFSKCLLLQVLEILVLN